MAGKKQGGGTSTAELIGEGFPVDAQVLADEEVKGARVQRLNFDLLTAPAPSRKFFADAFCIGISPDHVRLMFGQTKIDGLGLRAMIDLRISKHSLGDLADSLFTAMQFSVKPSPELPPFDVEPEQTVAMTANHFRIGVASESACIDAYYASPFSMTSIQRNGNKLFLDDIVRLQMSEALFVRVVDSAQKAVTAIRSGNTYAAS